VLHFRRGNALGFRHCAHQGAGITQKSRGNVVAIFVDEFPWHLGCFACDSVQGSQEILDGIIAHALHCNGAVQIVANRELRCFFADLAGFALIDLADAAEKTALEIAECIRTNAGDVRTVFDPLA